MKLVNITKDEYSTSDDYNKLLDEQNRVSKELNELYEKENNFNKLNEAFYVFYEDEELYRTNSIQKSLKDLKKELNQLEAVQNELNKLNKIGNRFKEKSLFENKFQEYKVELSTHGLQINEYSDVIKYEVDYQHEESAINKKNEANRQDLEELNLNIGKLLRKLEIKDGDINLISERIDQVESALNSFKELKNIISFDSNQTIKSIEKNVGRFSELFNSYKEIYRKNVEYDLYLKDSDKKISELNEEIKKNLPMMERAEKAFITINNILKNHSKSEFLNEFINDNLKRIENIFKLIHVPKEFDSISFENNEFLLMELITFKPRKITEISGGQRAALAISIFLSLNFQLKNGPNILLFDDPITYVDDLNTLSFLDYLRELVIDNDKQIFFATANNTLTYLFKKKFEFLGDDQFKEYKLAL